MDMQSLSEQQQHDLLASLFPSEDTHNNADNYHSTSQRHTGGRHPSPASSSSSGLHDTHSGPSLMDSSNIRRNSTVGSHNTSGNNSMFPPSSPIQPQSSNTQLTMQLLGSLMQMQGIDNHFPIGATPHLSPGFGGVYAGQSYSSPMNMGNMAGNDAGNSHSTVNHPPQVNGGNPSYGNSEPSGHAASTALLEQQIKLQQLQQLQQLQNQIFQQQIALISGQPQPVSGSDYNQSQQQNGLSSNTASPHFSGLPTPGPSNELRPQQPQLDFDHFSQPLPSPMSTHQHGLPFSHHSDEYIHRGTSSAPEHVAFHVRSGPTSSPHFSGGSRPDHDLDISPLTSPWLGAYAGNVSHSNDNDQSHESSRRASDQRQASNKRGPPTNGDEPSFSRKKHSSGIASVVEGAPGGSGMQSMNVAASTRRPYHKGSKSTTSTPLLRGSRSRSKSGAGNSYSASQLTSASGGGHPNQDPSGPPYPTPGGSVMDSSLSLPSVPGDTPSPVDLSMPPPPPPSAPSQDIPERTNTEDGHAANLGPQLTPLTPGVVMKLGPFSNNSSSASTPVPTPAPKTSKSKSKGESNAKASKVASTSAQSTAGLKHILPAGGSSMSPAGPSAGEPTGPVKKVSHKDAEQKRRDSQKTAYDDLRRLLPPITFEDDDEQGGQAVLSKKKDEVIPVRGPLPPGALPPRGPPKAGGEGPNKGVSKLQLLICGNQYMRTLKGRVERRDMEIARLRREVGRLRRKTESLEGRMERIRISGVVDLDGAGMDVDYNEGEEEGEEEIDLERDLDAIEGMGVHIGLVGEYEDDGEY